MAWLQYGAATGSSKPPGRATGVRPPNEDRWTAQDVKAGGGLVGVFDGHGGTGAAEFVSSHLPSMFQSKLQERLADSAGAERADVVPSVLAEAFLAADSALFQRVRSQKRGGGAAARCSRCKMYREKPCACTGVELPANVGSTGSLVYVRQSNLCAPCHLIAGS